MLQICDDFGTQTAPFLSTRSFRELVMPAYKRGLDWIHQHTRWKVLLHSDGAIFPLLPSIIEMGVDILNPVQTTATGMDPRRLKAEFGDRLSFWGGSCDCQHTLPRGTPEQVAAEVRAHLDALQQRFSANRIDYSVLDTSQPLDHALYRYLSRRSRMMKSR